jgi:sugar transferase (PEP-CTERM system associated)
LNPLRIFGHHVSRAAIVLTGIEVLVVYACMQIAIFVIAGSPDTPLLVHPEALFSGVIVTITMSLVGLYEQGRRALTFSLSGLADTFRIGFGVLLGLVILAIANAHGVLPALTPPVLVLGGGMAVAAVVTERLLFWRAKSLDLFKRRLIVIGAGDRASTLESAMGEDSPYQVLAYVDLGEDGPTRLPSNRVTGLPEGKTLLDLVRQTQAEEIVVAIRDRRGNLPIKQLLECKLQGIEITDLPTFFEREQQQIQLESLSTSWLVFGSGFRQDWFGNTVKRAADITASLFLLLLTLPIILATAVAIRLEGPGPILYWQTRVGRGNENFDICKFRSMRPDAEQDGLARWAADNDNRITRVGRVIRKLRIDELPQAYNVLKGEMSFVGPRPERPFFVEQLSTKIPFFLARHSIRPGITGWAQVRYPYGASVEDAKHKLEYDLYYVKNHTLFLDLVIMLETVKVVLFGRGAR